MGLPSAALLAFTFLSPAQQPANRSLAGHVEDPSGGAIEGAAVEVRCGDHARTTTSDASGRFEIRDLPAAECTVTASMDLFAPATVRLDLRSRSTGFGRLVLPVAGLEAEVVVTPARGEQERLFSVPQAVAITTREELESRPHQILPQALREEPGVLVQQTTTAQGSPFIRGFSAQRIVSLLDGIRFNTSALRAGATQYLGWIGPGLVERLEVVRGPASVQYGSDALGGTINVISLQPSTASGTEVAGSVEAIAGAADLSAGTEAFTEVRNASFAFRAGGSVRRLGELRPGRGRDSHAAVTRFLGLPSRQVYTRLPDTGFSQTGAHVLATAAAGRGATLSGAYLYGEQFGVSRYDRLLGGDGLHRSDFDPQRLDFGYLRYRRDEAGPLRNVSVSFSFNRQQDDRLEQARPSSRLDRERGRVLALGYQAQGTWLAGGRHAITLGGEVYDEYIASERTLIDPSTGAARAVRPEIPDGTRYTSAGAFVQSASDVIRGRLSLRGGVRYGHFLFRTRRDPALGVEAERVPADAVTFHSGGVVTLHPSTNLTVTVSRGFRAANAFDLGAIGISGGGFEIAPERAAALGALAGTTDGAGAVSTGRPVQPLSPESVYAFETGLKFRSSKLSAGVTVFDLELVDVMSRRTAIFATPVVGTSVAGFEIVRQDEAGRAFVAADPRPILTRANVDRARIVGLEADAQIRLTPAWIAGGYFSVVNGRELDTGTYLRRMPPPFGGVRLKWEPTTRSLWIEGTATFALTHTRLSPGDLGDARIGASRSRRAIADFFLGMATDLGLVQNGVLVSTGETLEAVEARVLGAADRAPLFTETPGFFVLGMRAGWRMGRHVQMTVLAENLTDRNYRWHGSGVDAPGVNVQLRARYSF